MQLGHLTLCPHQPSRHGELICQTVEKVKEAAVSELLARDQLDNLKEEVEGQRWHVPYGASWKLVLREGF